MNELPSLATAALGIRSPKGIPGLKPAETDFTCSFCGNKHPKGTPSQPTKLKAGFRNQSDLVAASERTCWQCMALCQADPMRLLMNSVVTSEGIYSCFQTEEKAYALLGKYKPPFAILLSNKKNSHLVWRTPVTRNSDLITVRMDEQTFLIQPKKIMEMAKMWKRVQKRTGKTPILHIDIKMKEISFGTPQNSLSETEAATFARLSAGELWALKTIVNCKKPKKGSPLKRKKN